MMDPWAMVILAIVIVGGICALVALPALGEQKPSTSTKSTKRSERYDRIWVEVEAGNKKNLNVLVASASRSGGKSYMAAYQQGYQKGYQEGTDYAIQELCDADGGST